MLVKIFPSLAQNKIIKAINWFLYSYIYVGLIAALTALCSIFGFEMYTYYAYVICGGIIPLLFCDNMTPMLAPLGMAYSSVSLKSNDSTKGAILFEGNWYHLIILTSLIFILVVGRLIFNLIINKELRHYRHYLLWGFVFFGFTLMFAGLGSDFFSWKSFGFGAVEFAALFGVYFLLMYLIDWKSVKKDYCLWLMVFYGLALSAEVIVIQIMNHGKGVQTGWGISNNIAGQLCMCLAAPVYFAIKKKASPLFITIGFIFGVSIALTNSRAGVLMSFVIALTSLIILIIKGRWLKRIVSISTIVVLVGLFITFFFVFKETSDMLFKKLLSTFDDKKGLETLSGRIPLWIEGWNNYLSNRPLGTGWYHLSQGGIGKYYSYNFIPPRYHNTLFQLIGSMGTFGLLAYIYHRYQTVRMTFTKPSLEKTFTFLCILGLLLTSLLDCHLFNLGPALNYGILLASIEGINLRDNIKVNRMRKPRFI